MTALPPEDHRKLVGILARLASDADGERAAAGLLATQLISRHGVGWAELLAPVAAEISLDDPKAERRASYPGRAGPPDRVRLLREHQRTAWVLLSSPYPWDEWQRRFLSDIKRLDAPLSTRQEAKLRECVRLREAGRVSA